jgi:hypothetical protein
MVISFDSFVIRSDAVWWHAVALWLRHYATNRKVAGSIPDEADF